MELLETKLVPPIEPRRLISRPRLQAYLEQLSNSRLTLIQTPAGYGKSSVLWQWYEALQTQEQCVGWISFDSNDRDPIAALAYVAGALAEHSEVLAQIARQFRFNRDFLRLEPLTTLLANALRDSVKPLYLFMDDVHLAGEDVLKTLQRLIEVAPATIHFTISCRITPPFPLARMRVSGDLLELTTEDLLFRAEETQQFLEERGHQSLTPEELKTLESRTEGWITGIKLASLAWRPNNDRKAFFAAFSGNRSTVADYFADEVLTAQTEELQHFLLTTSVLDRFTPDLCEAVTRNSNAREIIDEIEASGLFLLKLDGERTWYRYHHLFSDFLRRSLTSRDPEAEQRIYLRVSEWFRDNGDYLNSIHYALKAGSYSLAAELLESRCLVLAQTGHIRQVAQFAKQLPANVLETLPRVLLTRAWLCIYNLRYEEAERFLDLVRQYLREQDGKIDAVTRRHLQALLLHREMSLAAAQDDARQVERTAEKLIREHAEDIDLYLLSTAYSLLAYSQRVQYRLQNLEGLIAQARGASRRSGYPLSRVVYYAYAGLALTMLGKIDAADQTLTKGLQQAARLDGPRSALASLPALPLAVIAYERNDLGRVRRLVSDTLPAVTMFGFVDQFFAGYITQARLHVHDEEYEMAHQVLDEGMAIALDRSLERLQMYLSAERIHLLLKQGCLDQAVRHARAAGIPTSSGQITPAGRTHTTFEAQATAWVRIAQKQGRFNEAIQVAKQWRRFSNSHNAVYSLIRWNILLAQCLLLDSDLRAAQRCLREALLLAAPRRIIRSFLDEGAIMQTLLEQAVEEQPATDHPLDLFARELLDAFSPDKQAGTLKVELPAAEGLYGKLTHKELEILSLVAAGMRNAEVAGKLGMTEGSVKWYLQQIYDKLGTRRRLQAVERARQLGLIA